jgi:hypothetical protein
MSQIAEPEEAVVISGARRGQIIRLPAQEEAITDEEIRALNRALDELIAAIERVSLEVRATTAAIQGNRDRKATLSALHRR